MKKKLSYFFIGLSLLLSHIMCIVVAYNYGYMTLCVEYRACSAPVEVSYMYGIPYMIGIVICWILAYKFYRD